MDKPKVSPEELERALSAVGDLLAEAGTRVGIVVVGGVAMNLHGFEPRSRSVGANPGPIARDGADSPRSADPCTQ